MHEILHDVNERSPLIRDKEGFFLGLAYDVRKAYEGQRLKSKKQKASPEVGPRFGFPILWPTLLVQCRQLRDSLAFLDHGKEHQIITYELEFLIEQALKKEFRQQAAELQEKWERLSACHPYLEENAETRVAQFAAWTQAERQEGFTGLLMSLDPMYPTLYRMRVVNGSDLLLSPETYDQWREREFPDPNW